MADSNSPALPLYPAKQNSANTNFPLQQGKIGLAQYDTLTTLREPHLDPRRDAAEGKWGAPP